MKLNIVVIYALFALFMFLYTAAFIDYKKRKNVIKYPFISFIIPAFNAENIVENAIKSLYNSYPNFELIVINDGSKDNTLNKLKDLQKKYKFKIINNEKNIGKAAALNKAAKFTKGDFIGFIDADTIVSKEAFKDLISRFQANNRLGAAGCGPSARNIGILPSMQDLEYNMHSLSFSSYNLISAVVFFGGCIITRKKAFIEAGMFGVNVLGEDTDLALKINEKGWKVELSYTLVDTDAPRTIKSWLRQKLRWGGAYAQNFIIHWKTHLRNPITYIFLTFYLFVTLMLFLSMWRNNLFIPDILLFLYHLEINGVSFETLRYYTAVNFGPTFKNGLITAIIFSLFSLPYAITGIKKPGQFYKILLVIPFTLIYLPIWMFINTISIGYGIYKYNQLKAGRRAW